MAVLRGTVGLAEDVAGWVGRRGVMSIETLPAIRPARVPWNKGRIVGQKRPLLPKHVWSIRFRLEMAAKSDTSLTSCYMSLEATG